MVMIETVEGRTYLEEKYHWGILLKDILPASLPFLLNIFLLVPFSSGCHEIKLLTCSAQQRPGSNEVR